MKRSDIGAFQEQQPNGKIATSWTRITLTVPLLMAVAYLFFVLWEHHTQFNTILDFLKAGIIDKGSFVAISSVLKTVDYVVLGSLLSITFGVKLFQKGQENKALDNEIKETPTEVKLEQLKTEANNVTNP